MLSITTEPLDRTRSPVPHARNSALGALLVLPWLIAYTAGPVANAWPWLVSASCAVLVWLFWRRLDAGLITSAWVLAAAISAVIGLVQYFGLAQALSPWISQAGAGEAFANLRQRNHFATLTSIGLLALSAVLARQAPGPRVPGWAYAAMALLALGNAASSSRTGLLQWLLIVVLTAGWALPALRGQRRLALFALQALLAYGLAVVALPWLLSAATGLSSAGLLGRLAETPACSSRLTLWSNVLHLIAHKPWFGWGWGELDYAHYMTLYPGARFCDILDNAHNLPLHLAVELGIPLALVVCGGAGWVVWRARPWRETDPTRQMAWGVLAVIMLHSMLEYPLWYGPFQMAFGLCVWMLWPAPREPVAGSRPYARAGAAIRLVVASALLAAVAYAAWDYHRISQIYLAPQARDPAYRDDTLDKVRGSRLFRNQVRFAELTTTALKRGNAQWTFDTAMALLHYSPEPRVIEKVIESAVMLGRDDEALLHLVRYRAAFPDDYKKWRHANGLTGGPAD
ncbi:PglL family O-oligosaccharyltransferase [Polaromonas sp.]|uniref:PglL family O-oligosaccharyltransferase n=1 Tax=Polaromonas sp. TaxID=1869339 RepID=UPI003523DFA3